MKKILIAIPTARYIEPETFRSIYNLVVPEGYKTEFQYFYGYRVDQVRNLIADWTLRSYDYLFAVDHDITFPPDTLVRMLAHDVDLVTGVYRQRIEPQAIEIFDLNHRRMDIAEIAGRDLVEIGGCGFGCVLVKKHVFEWVGYPQFEYHVALNHSNTVSEDTDFCRKARNKGFSLWCDPSILCGHIGSTTMTVQVPNKEYLFDYRTEFDFSPDPNIEHFKQIQSKARLPEDHVKYLRELRDKDRVHPKVVYDIGANVLHWTDCAKELWPDAQVIAFEGMSAVKSFYDECDVESVCGVVLGHEDGTTVEFYENLSHPAGNSIYRENPEYSSAAAALFTDKHKVTREMWTLDTLRRQKMLPAPDLIKIDVQGAEFDVILGAEETLKSCSDVIVELQHVEYNIDAPTAKEVIDYMKEIGFQLVGDGPFCSSGVDGDYHFVRTRHHQ